AANVRRRNRWVEVADLLPHRRLEGHRRHARPENQIRGAAQPRHALGDDLPPRKVNIKRRLHFELLLFYIANHTDDLNRTRTAVRVVDQKSWAKSRAIRKNFARERCTNQRDCRTIRVILIGEIASASSGMRTAET